MMAATGSAHRRRPLIIEAWYRQLVARRTRSPGSRIEMKRDLAKKRIASSSADSWAADHGHSSSDSTSPVVKCIGLPVAKAGLQFPATLEAAFHGRIFGWGQGWHVRRPGKSSDDGKRKTSRPEISAVFAKTRSPERRGAGAWQTFATGRTLPQATRRQRSQRRHVRSACGRSHRNEGRLRESRGSVPT